MKKTTHKGSYSDTALIRCVEGYPLPVTTQYLLQEPMTNEEINDLVRDVVDIDGRACLVAFLRGDAEISPRIRNWLADMLLDDAETPKKLALQNRGSKRPQDSHLGGNLKSRSVALHMEKLIKSGVKKEEAALQASKKYWSGLDGSAAKRAYKELLEVRKFQESMPKSLQAQKSGSN